VAVETEVNLTGSGTIGEIVSWGVEEDATPAAIGDSSGAVGAINVTARREETSDFVINNNVEIDHPHLGQSFGRVTGSNTIGGVVSFSASGFAGLMNSERYIPAVGSGSPVAALDMVHQIYYGSRLTLPYVGGRYWSMFGHDAGFDVEGFLLLGRDESTTRTYHYDISLLDFWVMLNSNKVINGITGLGYEQVDSMIYATAIDGDWMGLSDQDTVGIEYSVMYKMLLDGETNEFTYMMGPDDSNIGTGKIVTVTTDPTAATLTIAVEYRSGGIKDTATTVLDISTLDMDEELQIAISSYYSNDNNFNVSARITQADFPFSFLQNDNLGLSTTRDWWVGTWRITGKSRAVYLNSRSLTEASWDADDLMLFYENESYGYEVQVADWKLDGPITGGRYNAWQYLNDVAAANAMEFGTNSVGELVIRDVGSHVLNINNIVDPPNINVNIQSTGLNIDVIYQNSEIVTQEVDTSGGVPSMSNPNNHIIGTIYKVWDAFDEDTVYTVESGKTTDISLELDSTVTLVYNPTPSYYWDDPDTFVATRNQVVGAGRYVVSGADNLPVPFQEWLDYGGDVTARINPESGFVDVKIIGPREEIPGVPGPYSLAVSDGSTSYPAFTIAGRGVLASPETTRIGTGASTATTQVELVNTIDNPAVCSLADAYDRGMWAAAQASGPAITLSTTLPVTDVTFGLVAGSLIQYNDNVFRITHASISNAAVSIDASYFATVGDFDTAWDMHLLTDFDSLWNGFVVQELKIRPLRQPGLYNESLTPGLDVLPSTTLLTGLL
jgi:hypothetical protein